MLKELLKNTKFLSDIRTFYNNNEKEVIDILLFGSIIKGKSKPSDIDLLIIYKSKDNIDLNYQLKKQLEKYKLNMQITSKIYPDIFKTNFKARESILSEGYSLVNNISISEGLGYSNLKLFKYELKNLNKSERMRFYYALYGRNNAEGVLKDLNAKKFSDTIILCPIANSENMTEFFNSWKLVYLEMPVLIPIRMSDIFK